MTRTSDQVRMSLQVYRDRNEFDGRSVAQARRCLQRARYVWTPELAECVRQLIRAGAFA